MNRPSWVDRVNQTQHPTSPPRNASTAAWRTYAEGLGYEIAADAGRDRIIAIVEAGPPPAPKRPPRIPKVQGPIFEATEKAVAAAAHLTEMDQPAVAVLLDLAMTIDGMDQRGGNAPWDNVTVPTFLRYSESLGLTPTSRMKLDIKPAEGPSKLGELRAIRGGRADR